MQIDRVLKLILVTVVMATVTVSLGAVPRITVEVEDDPAVDISPLMWGLFIEDINFAGDGGLYPEKVKNRSFEFERPMMGWQILRKDGAKGDVLLYRYDKQPRNPNYAQFRVKETGGGFGLNNEGFRGMGIRKGAGFDFTIQARKVEGSISALRVEIINSEGKVIGKGKVSGFEAGKWKTYETELTATETAAKATMNLWVEGTGKLDFDMVSLFPHDTYKDRENGLRPDLVKMMEDMKPGFLRFPGGCIVEGFDLSQRYQWKNTIGPLDERVVTINRWNFEFQHKPAPDYYQSYGLGYYEYFQLAEDLNAEPMPILNIGMACQFNTGELVPVDELGPYIQDALDLIEFANGPADSEWGSVRAEMGHPEPFNMKMLGAGNEQWGPQYIERYKPFVDSIKAHYPDIQIVAATGSDATIFPNGEEEIDYLWKQWMKLDPEIVDEHFYRTPDFYLENVDWYDDYDRSGPKLFVGEYGAQSVGVASPDNENTWRTALYEAAFLIGFERNADLVRLSSYAPLFGHLDAWQWKPDLIYFNNLDVFGSANYYVHKMFSTNPGTHMLTATVDDKPKTSDGIEGLHASAQLDKDAGEVIIKVANATKKAQKTSVNLSGAGEVGGEAKVIILKSGSLKDFNTIDNQKKIYPEEFTASVTGPDFEYEFAPLSFTIIRVPVE
ncbi:MAG: alpha-L-arabinofuranosidase [Candidatus Marinimicrobia bacterium]|nr:alpha-L-arabinofuranosidase [Candidatus Neomarinimicrobiota bacterium]MCF7880245.1 alpha-L-arabinofuranosidase [Candidatus Neomarinimicrobiota bacterium]